LRTGSTRKACNHLELTAFWLNSNGAKSCAAFTHKYAFCLGLFSASRSARISFLLHSWLCDNLSAKKIRKHQTLSAFFSNYAPLFSPSLVLSSQNIDGLEMSAGVSSSKLISCHGSLATVSCTGCKKQFPVNPDAPSSTSSTSSSSSPSSSSSSSFQAAVAAGRVARCEHCNAVLKPDVTFFGEPLRSSVKRALESDRNKADFLIVMGTSLQVPLFALRKWLPYVFFKTERLMNGLRIFSSDDILSNVFSMPA
jgi:NAD-dependent SIR2 family protein deacetylase